MTTEMQQDMSEASIPVDDNEEEPMFEWDRDNPNMSVGTSYPSMDDFRLAVQSGYSVLRFGSVRFFGSPANSVPAEQGTDRFLRNLGIEVIQFWFLRFGFGFGSNRGNRNFQELKNSSFN
jgi:hypothetical protein